MRRILSIVLCVCLLLSASGCGIEGKLADELDMSIVTSPATVDPQTASEVTCFYVISLFMSTLYTYDENSAVAPGTAESYEMSPDGLCYTFHLRDGLKWSDGTPLTAQDYVFGFRRLVDPETASGSVYLMVESCRIKHAAEIFQGGKAPEELGVSAPDDRTFVVELEEPCPYLISLMAQFAFSPCNEAFYKKCNGNYATSQDTILSCGPYVLDRYEPLAAQIHLSKNPNYYDSELVRKLPSGFTFQVAGNNQQAVMCYETEQLDVVGISDVLLEKYAGDENLRTIQVASLQFIQFGNMKNSPVKNVHIRKALGRSLDRDSFVHDFLKAGAYPWQRISPKDYYQETDGTDFSGDDAAYDDVIGYDPEAAKKEWEQGLKETGADKIELELAYNNREKSKCEVFKQQWEKTLPGLSIKMIPLPTKEWLNALNTSKNDLIYQGWNSDYADPTGFMVILATGARGEMGYSNPAFDQMLRESFQVSVKDGPDARNRMLHKMEDMLLEDMAIIPLLSQEKSFLVASDYSDFDLNPIGAGFTLTSLIRKEK